MHGTNIARAGKRRHSARWLFQLHPQQKPLKVLTLAKEAVSRGQNGTLGSAFHNAIIATVDATTHTAMVPTQRPFHGTVDRVSTEESFFAPFRKTELGEAAFEGLRERSLLPRSIAVR